jgi:hypothetical protein
VELLESEIGDKAALVLGDQQLVPNSVGERGLPLADRAGVRVAQGRHAFRE